MFGCCLASERGNHDHSSAGEIKVESYQDGIFEAGEIVFAPWIGLQGKGKAWVGETINMDVSVDDVHQVFGATSLFVLLLAVSLGNKMEQG